MKRVSTKTLERLFSGLPKESPYGNVMADQLLAVQRGEKAMAMYNLPRQCVEEGDVSYRQIMRNALDIGLSVSMQRDQRTAGSRPHVFVFVHRDQDAWRVPAWVATRTVLARYRWSEGLEALESMLLGYSDEHTKRWIEIERSRQVEWGRPTAYALMSTQCRSAVISFGQRSFPCDMPIADYITWFASRDRLPMTSQALAGCPSGQALARVSWSRTMFNETFTGQFKSGRKKIARLDRAARDAVEFNKYLESKIQFLGTDGWS